MIGCLCLWAESILHKLSRKTRGNDYFLSAFRPSFKTHSLLLPLCSSTFPFFFLLRKLSLMEITWENPISSSRGQHGHPSFSSTLLDQIYRSIDQDSPPEPTSRKKKQQQYRYSSLHEDREISPAKHRRSIAADFERSRRRSTTTDSVFLRYSNSTSSDSSGFSSSESDSFYKHSKSSAPRQPKPIRTSIDTNSSEQKPTKQELTGFLRTKSKALKIYTDLKKVKQPISPGGRLATFLNSLLPTNPKKPKKITTTTPEQQSPAISSTTCSSASSFSRSCLSKTPSSSGKSKRSVRFCPVNVILDEEYSSIHMPHGYSNKLYGNNEAKRDRHAMEEENRRVIEAAKDLLRTFQKNKDHMEDVSNVEEEDDDDVLSCASSDLFELENLSAIGIERYQEELPVYETTRFDKTNRAVAT